jgi:hypothetical protein
VGDDADEIDFDQMFDQLFSPAQPAPGFYKPQTPTATAAEVESFIQHGINQQFATPAPVEVLVAAEEEEEQRERAEAAAAKRQLPPEYQARLAAAAGAAAAALAAARGRPGGLNDELLETAEAAAAVASATRSPFTAEVRQQLLQNVTHVTWTLCAGSSA